MSDNRKGYIHAIHSGGHFINALLKEGGRKGIETTHIYRSKSPEKAANNIRWQIYRESSGWWDVPAVEDFDCVEV